MRTLITTLLASAMSFAALQAQAADAVSDVPLAPAADFSAPAGGNWAGGYAGGNVTWQHGHFNKQSGNSADGFGVGAYGGYNMQDGQLVYGGEADINYSDIDSKNTARKAEQGVNGSLRARVGVDLNPVLVYGTGGVATSRAKMKDHTSSDTRTMYGWTAGVGAEGYVTDNVTARVEYRYTDYSSKRFDLDSGNVRAGLNDQSVRVGMGYKF
ncbi:outer membrane protein [Mycoplana dimorpha]|uniref:Outer membrane immunogenic protein n=1 Tax=Mycoplana dimorpha TaxID=28320 RepID=A0A2T5AZE7_MYCDI|nr:outer membrane protein [Mycoplana dimorpha]PTM92090.1 outer membrane immunogenic protein [Mycoplana dimorpha]